jgi:hypothetical protein
MNPTLTLLTALLLAPLTALHAAEPLSLQPPQHLGAPKAEHAPTLRAFTGIPSLTITARGRLWAVWYAGITPAEDKNNYVVVAASGDRGRTWNEVLVIDPDGRGPAKAFDPQAWIDPSGTLWISWSQRSIHDERCGLWCVTIPDADSDHPSRSMPRRLTDGIMMNKPVILSSGEWVMAVSTHGTDDSVKTIVSSDQGRTWSVRGTVNVPKDVRVPDEPMMVERKDGSLWMLVRTRYGIGQAFSKDRGQTWTALVPSEIRHPASRFHICRLVSGNLLLVKHGPIEVRTGRSHLMAFVSKDDGFTWSHGLLLDERNGVSYPDGVQDKDGLIWIAYDSDRKGAGEILLAKFREEDAAVGKNVSGTVSLKQVISRLDKSTRSVQP